ncbi:glycoside hydrolase family 43 protein [Cyathus striatus]|nr:glycoside hydrolase family 43 protein [Cyathus striatus]
MWYALVSLFSLSTFLVASAQAVPNPFNVTGNTAVADPSMCQDKHGTYFVFSTAQGISIRTSPNLVNWTLIGTVWSEGANPNWTDPYTQTSNGSLWSPDCTYLNGEFILYYSASTVGSQNSAIFLAKSETGLPGSWVNHGLVTSTSSANDYNVCSIFTYLGKEWFLSFGNFWTGIKLVSLDPLTGLLRDRTMTSLAERSMNAGNIGASVIFGFGGYFYLFTSWDNCCQGLSSTYNIRVGRGTNVMGPYVDQDNVDLYAGGGTLVLSSHENIIGSGGQDLLLINGKPILVYHYYTPTGSYLGINNLDFSSGWPVSVAFTSST